jgi:anti-sigma-K factor RskA
MNTLEIEDRVRAATRAAADTVAPDSVPPLRLSSERLFRSRYRSTFRSRFRFREGSRTRASVWARRLAPLAAAVAVVAVAIAMVMVGRTVDHGTGGTAAASGRWLRCRCRCQPGS